MVQVENRGRHGTCVAQALLGLLLALWPWLTSTAQVAYGSIVGRVSDSSGAVVKSASVRVTDLGTDESRVSTTYSDGDYRFVNLIPGKYRIDVKAAGFRPFTRRPIDVTVDTTVRIDAALIVGSANESVEVQEQTPPLDTQDSSVGQVIEGRQVQETPLNGRNVMNLLALLPGVVPQGGTQGSTAGNYAQSGDFTNVAGFGNYQISGGLAGQNAFFFDGSSLNEVMSNDTVLVPTQDTVQEFRVVTSVPSPEIGALAGGAVSFTSKSGSNAVHGSLYEYLRNTVLDANNFFNNLSGVPRPQLVQNQFGATIGGPIVRNRRFFFFDYERFTRRNGIPFSGRVPTRAELSGDFSADPPIYDPLTRQQFTCNGMLNVICPNRIDATANVMANVLHYWPLSNANLAGGTVNYIANAKAGVDTNQYNARIDQIVSDKQRVFGRYTYWNINTLPTQYIFGTTSGGPTSAVSGLVADQQVVIGDVYTFSPSTVGDFRISYLHANTPITPANNNVNISQFGPFWAGISSSLTHQQFPAPYIVNTIASPYAGLDVTNNDSGNSYSLAASLTKVTGRHTLKFGADLRRYQFREGQTVFAPGFFIFAGIFTSGALSPPGSGATPIADFVLGAITPDPGVSGFQTAATAHATQSHSGTGEEWADDDNGMTSADAQAFKRACSCFGLGRYFYDIQAIWVDLDQNRQPVRTPALFAWALPENWREGVRPSGRNGDSSSAAPSNGTNGRSQANRSNSPKVSGNGHAAAGDAKTGASGANGDDLDVRILSMEKTVGTVLYRNILREYGRVNQPKLIRDPAVKRTVLQMLESAIRGIERLEAVTRRLDEKTVVALLAKLQAPPLGEISDMKTLQHVVFGLEELAGSNQHHAA